MKVKAPGGVSIADRLRLDPVDPATVRKSGGGKAAACAGVAGLIALAAAGILTYILWQHWEFLMPA